MSVIRSWNEGLRVSGNLVTITIFYTLLGAFVSYVLYYLFDTFDEKWKKERSVWFQLADISVELSLISIIMYWATVFIQSVPPFFYVRKELDLMVDNFVAGIFIVYAVMVFLDELTAKLKYIFNKSLERYFSKIFPQYGSILDLSLSYTPPKRKTEENKLKETEQEEEHGMRPFAS